MADPKEPVKRCTLIDESKYSSVELVMLANRNKPLCSFCPRLKTIKVGKRFLRSPVPFDEEGRQILRPRGRKYPY